MGSIKHIWFDFSETIVRLDKPAHAKLRYGSYADVVGKPVTPELIEEYESLFEKHKSHSAIFASLGLPDGYWSERYASADPESLLKLANPNIPDVLQRLREIVPISIFSNVQADKFFPALGIDSAWFTHLLGPQEVKNPKPALDGFHLMIQLSNLPAENILFVGDSVEKELKPAKSLGLQTALMWKSSPDADYCFQDFEDILTLVAKL
ncbi:MAG: HAD family hydrolase [Patescibacteria group bacterium]